jgi:hypothetical protein
MVTEVEEPFFIGLDGSAFDAHVVPGALKAEWEFYRRALRSAGYAPSVVNKFMAMGRCQLRNKVRVRCDDGFVSYTVEGNRMSGDLNTGLGNSVLQSGFIASVMAECNVPDQNWRMLVDGDDAVLIVSRKYLPSSARIRELFGYFSQDVKMEGPFDLSSGELERIDFCQCRPVCVDGEWRLIRDPYKVYNCYKMQPVYFRTREEARRFFATVAPPEMIYASGVPVQEALFRMFHRLAGDSKPLESVSRRFWLRNAGRSNVGHADRIAWSTRESFAKAFGIGVLEQLQLEHELDLLDVGDLAAAELRLT